MLRTERIYREIFLLHPDSYDAGQAFHSWTDIHDAGAGTDKLYWPVSVTTSAPLVVPSVYKELNADGSVNLEKDYAWATNGLGNAYVGSVTTTLNPGAPSAIQAKSAQSVDNYGNLTQQLVYDYGNLATPARTYNFTYLSDSNYTSRYIRNRLVSGTVTTSSGTITLAAKNYDGTTIGALQDVYGLPLHDSNYSSSFTYRGNATQVDNFGTWTSYSYQISGVPYLEEDGSGHTVQLSNSSSTGYSLPDTLTPNGNSNLATSLTYASSFAVTSVTGPNGATSTVNYDGWNRPLTSTSSDGAVTNFTYSYNPNVQTATLGSQWKKTTLDGFGRVTSVQTGHDSTTVSEVDTKYAPCACSPLGKVSQVSEPYAAGGQPVWTTYTYDGSGRTLTVTKPDGSVTHYAYSGASNIITDPAGKWKTYTNDSSGNLSTVVEPDPNTQNGTLTTTYTYNGANQLTNVSMPRNGVNQFRTFTWSGSDMLSASNPENGTVTYQYNGSHQVTLRTDAKGQQTQYTYDSYGRLSQVQHYLNLWNPLGQYYYTQEDPTEDVNYYYDTNPLNGAFSQNAWGRLAAVAFNSTLGPSPTAPFNYEYSYNTAGRVTAQRTEFPINWGSHPVEDLDVTYTWDNQGRMTQITYPASSAGYTVSAPTYQYQYDNMSNLSGINRKDCVPDDDNPQICDYYNYPTMATATAYNFAGQWTSLSYLGINASRGFNNMLQLTSESAASSQGSLLSMQYNYTTGQNNGRIAQAVDYVFNETVNYTYDGLNRLSSAEEASNKWNNAFAYDGWGNMTGQTWSAGQVLQTTYNPSSSNQIWGTADANGNVTFAPQAGSNLSWDVENRLIQQTGYSFGYDPSNKRIVQNGSNDAGPSSLVNIYSITGQRLGTYQVQYDQDNRFSTLATSGLNLYFGGKLIQSNGVTVATDRLGSVRGNANGEKFAYYPYGKERTSTASGREKFGTYYQDSGDQNYADQRYYDSYGGTFYSPDPGGLGTADPTNPGSWNRYAYVTGDPVSFVDPTGREGCDPGDPFCSVDCDDDPFAPGCAPIGPGGGGPPAQPLPCDAPSSVLNVATALGGPASGTAAACVSGVPGEEYLWETGLSNWNQVAAGSSFLPQLAGAAGASGTIILGGQVITWEIVIGALTAPEVVLTVGAVAGAVALYHALHNALETSAECQQEWEEAEAYCAQLLRSPSKPPGVWGRSYRACVLGQVSERCGGSPISHGKGGAGAKQ